MTDYEDYMLMWTSDASDPFEDILSAKRHMEKMHNPFPNKMILSPEVYVLLHLPRRPGVRWVLDGDQIVDEHCLWEMEALDSAPYAVAKVCRERCGRCGFGEDRIREHHAGEPGWELPKVVDVGYLEGRSILRSAYRPWSLAKRMQEIESIGVARSLT